MRTERILFSYVQCDALTHCTYHYAIFIKYASYSLQFSFYFNILIQFELATVPSRWYRSHGVKSTVNMLRTDDNSD